MSVGNRPWAERPERNTLVLSAYYNIYESSQGKKMEFQLSGFSFQPSLKMQINIQIHDQLAPEVSRFHAAIVDRRPLHADLAGGVARMLREHFVARGREGNKRGWPSRKFWVREGRQNTSVTAISATGAEVTVASAAIAHKVAGGTIRAKRGRSLAIPLTAQAYAAGSPREGGIKDLFFVRSKKGRAFLAIKAAGDKIKPHYLLTPSVNQRADPRAVPPERDIDALIQTRADAWLARHAPR
jgi:hypothetical protein